MKVLSIRPPAEDIRLQEDLALLANCALPPELRVSAWGFGAGPGPEPGPGVSGDGCGRSALHLSSILCLALIQSLPFSEPNYLLSLLFVLHLNLQMGYPLGSS